MAVFSLVYAYNGLPKDRGFNMKKSRLTLVCAVPLLLLLTACGSKPALAPINNKYPSKSFTVYGEPVEPFALNTSTSSVRTDDIDKLLRSLIRMNFKRIEDRRIGQ